MYASGWITSFSFDHLVDGLEFTVVAVELTLDHLEVVPKRFHIRIQFRLDIAGR